MSVRGLKKNVGKGDCYPANFKLGSELYNQGIEVRLCHGIVQAADFYKHMKPGTLFMHCWVEAKHPEHGWKVGDNQLGELTYHPRQMFYDALNPRHVIKMTMEEAAFHANRTGRYGGWDLHPAHGWY